MKYFLEKYRLEILFLSCTLGIVVFGFLVGIICSELSVSFSFSSFSRTPKPVVMILPHQDDEMFMAGKFLSFVEKGHPVYAALVTDGGNSHIRTDLQRSGYKSLNHQGFVHARNLEFFDSMKTLGIPADHILFLNPGGVEGGEHPLYQDGSLSDRDAKEIVEKIYNQIGDGIYMTASGGHSDHVVLEKALKQFPGISQKLFFPLVQTSQTQPFFLPSSLQTKKQQALSAYAVWKPEEQRFAIGERSAASLIDKWSTSSLEYFFEEKSEK